MHLSDSDNEVVSLWSGRQLGSIVGETIDLLVDLALVL